MTLWATPISTQGAGHLVSLRPRERNIRGSIRAALTLQNTPQKKAAPKMAPLFVVQRFGRQCQPAVGALSSPMARADSIQPFSS